MTGLVGMGRIFIQKSFAKEANHSSSQKQQHYSAQEEVPFEVLEAHTLFSPKNAGVVEPQGSRPADVRPQYNFLPQSLPDAKLPFVSAQDVRSMSGKHSARLCTPSMRPKAEIKLIDS